MKTQCDLSIYPAHGLEREAFAEIILTLRAALPRPLTERPAAAAKRDRAAMAAVAKLLPETAVEGRLAAQFVAADAWAMDCLQLAHERQREPRIADRCRAQAMGMMREGKSALRLLAQLQAKRRALEADEAATGRAAWVEHAAVTMMDEAFAAPPELDAATPDGSGSSAGDCGAMGQTGIAHPMAYAAVGERKSEKSGVETMVRLPLTAGLAGAAWRGDGG